MRLKCWRHKATCFALARPAIFLAFIAIAYLFGIYSEQATLWAVSQIHGIKNRLRPSPVQFDKYGRLSVFPDKQEVACPAQTPQTAVLFVFGQSNSANHEGQRYRAIDSRVLNFYNGKCYIAESPLLGASGEFGESWTLLGNKLIEKGAFDQVIIVPAGIGNTTISQWAVGGNLNPMLSAALDKVGHTYKITHVLWHQGEGDFLRSTTTEAYVSDFWSMLSTVRNKGIGVPFYVSTASWEPVKRKSARMAASLHWAKINPVTIAQKELPDGKTVFAGVDTDADISELDRYDGTHFSSRGQEIFANKWVEILTRSAASD